MANEFVARRGIIVPTGGASITGSVLVSGAISASSTITATSFTGSFSGSIGTATTASYVSPSGLPAGTVSASSQVVWSQVAYNAGIVSSSAQVQADLPAGTVSSSAQYPGWVTSSAQVNTGSFTGSFNGTLTSNVASGSPTVVNTNNGSGLTLQGTGNGQTAQLRIVANGGGWLDNINTAYFQISSSTGNNAAFMGGTYSADATFDRLQFNSKYTQFSNNVFGTTPTPTYVFQALNLTSSAVPVFGIFGANGQTGNYLDVTTSGSTVGNIFTITGAGKVGIGTPTPSATLQIQGNVSASSFTGSILANNGVVSSSAQVTAFLPVGTVSSSAQYPGWVTASSQIDITATTNYGLVAKLASANTFTAINTFAATGSYGTVKIIGPSASEASLAFRTTDVSDGTSGDWIIGTNQALLANKQFGLWNGANASVFPIVVDPNGQVGINLNRSTSQNVTAPLTVVGNANITGSVIATAGFTGSILANNGVVSSSTQVTALLPANTVSSSAQVTAFLPGGTVSSSAQYPGWVTASSQIVWSQVAYNAGIVSSSAQVQPLLPGGTVSSSGQVTAFLPTGTVSSSTQFTSLTAPFTGSFTGSFTGDGSNLTGIATTLYISGSTSGNSGINLKTQPLVVSGANGITSTVSGNTLTIAAPAGTVSSSGQVSYTGLSNIPSGIVSSSTQVQTLLPGGTVSSSAQYPGWMTASSQVVWSSVNYNAGIVSSSAQVVADIAGQSIAPSSVSASGNISGASLNITGNGTFGGNVTITGLLTAASQSIQYVSSSQLNVSTNRIVVNTDNSLRFGGLSVIDSGSGNNSGSLYWDSLNNRWVYENNSGQAPYHTAILVNGPVNTGALGSERGFIAGRVPVAVADDHIDSAPQSSSIRVDFVTGRTDIEQGLFVTGSLTANGTVTLQGIPSSSAQVQALLPGGTVSSSAQYPGWVTSSAQVNTGSFTGSFVGTFTGSVLANNGVVSSSAQVTALLPANTVSSSTQIVWSSVPYNTGIVSSSAQVAPLLPNGTVSSSAQYPGWVTASSQIQLASITGTSFASSNFTFPQGVTVTGLLTASTSAYVNNTLYSGSTVTGIVGPVTNQVVASFPTGSYNSAHFDYIINDGTNYRAGTVITVWNASTNEFTETSTNDLGNTSQATFAVDILAGVARLKFSNTSGTWTVRTGVRAI